MNTQMLSGSVQRCLALPQATARTSACQLLRPVAQIRGRYQRVQATAFTSLAPSKLPSLLTPNKLLRASAVLLAVLVTALLLSADCIDS